VTKFVVTVSCCSVSCWEQLVCQHCKYEDSDRLWSYIWKPFEVRNTRV